MSHHSISQSEKITYTSMVKEPEDYDSEIMNTSSYSIPTDSVRYDEGTSDTEKTKNFDISGNLENNSLKALKVAFPQNSIKSQQSIVLPSRYKPRNSSINTSLQNNINDDTENLSEISPNVNDKILPSSIITNLNRRKSTTLDNKSEFDNRSVIVEINDKEEEIIKIENNSLLSKGKGSDGFEVHDHQISELNEAINLKKMQLAENRVSVATSGDYTYVDTDQPQSSRNVESENDDISEQDIKKLKRLTDTTSVPPVFDNAEINNISKIQDKEEADIANNDHKITIEDEEEDNTCAICLIETQKPTDIEEITGNKDGSNETVVTPSKEDIDNFECKLHCMHKFHYSCIAQWLERSQNCPICRVEIKHYEIEAIEKRFDISIKVKEEPIPLIQPHYNNSFEFDTILSERLVRSYLNEHFPWIKFKPYIYTRFLFYFIGYMLLAIAGIVISIFSFINEKMFFASYVIVIILIIGFIILLGQLFVSLKRKKLIEFMIGQPASSSVFYGLVILIFILLFANLNNFVSEESKSHTLEKIYQFCIIAFFSIMMIWSCVEAKFCYAMYKEDNRRTVDAEVSRRNQEIINRTRQEEAREREEFERNFSHLND